MGVLVLSGIILVFAGVSIAVATYAKKNKSQFPHPSELSSQSRSTLRPLRQAVESFEQAVKANKSAEASQILGNQAQGSVRQTLAEASKMMKNRDLLVGLAQRLKSQGGDAEAPLEAVERIDRNIIEATQAIDQLTFKITQAAISEQTPMSEIESDLPDLINRLQNVSQSFDEVNQHLNQDNLS